MVSLDIVKMLTLQTIFWVSLFLISYTYLFYPLLVYFLSVFFKKEVIRNESEESLPSVSIVMAAYNEEAYIEAKIRNCLSLDYPEDRLEIIIGSDGSDDGTNEIAGKYAENGVSFYPHAERRGKMAVINDAVKEAKGDILVFSDISELFDRDAVKKLVRNFADPSIGAVTGNHILNQSSTEIGKGTLMYWRYQRWLQRTESRLETIFSCDGTIYACRRKLFSSPPEGTINDDKAVPLGIIRQGFRVIFEPEAVARGDVIEDSGSFFNQKVRGQAGMYQIFWMFRDMFLPKKPFVWLTFMSHSVGPVLVPWCLLVLLFSNISLYSVYPYTYVLILQLLFYSSSIIGALSYFFKMQIPFVYIPYFFVVGNSASLLAFWAYLFNMQKATWKKLE